MFMVYNVGMIYFDNCEKGYVKRALIPDGREGGKNTPPHYASLYVAADKVDLDKTNWWSWGGKFEREVTFTSNGHHTHVRVYEFRIKKSSDLLFPEKRNGGAVILDADKLQQPNRKTFELASDPKTIGRVVLRGGKLEACSLGSVPVVRWTVEEHADPIRITARDDDGNLYSVVLKDSQALSKQGVNLTEPIEMVLANTPDIAFLEGIAHHETDPNSVHSARDARGDDGARQPSTNGNGDGAHAIVYSMLNRDRRHVQFIGGDPQSLLPIMMKRGLIEYLATSPAYQKGHCTPTCCYNGGGGGS